MRNILIVIVAITCTIVLSGCWFFIVPIPNYTSTGGQPAVTPDHSAEAANSNSPGWGLKKGMTRDEVLKLLGEPTIKEEYGSIIFWYYQEKLKVNFQKYDKDGDYFLTNWTDLKTR
jgi:outer membrane protein assembly factor BamE (lipoprotein component of BamABCDE complex)